MFSSDLGVVFHRDILIFPFLVPSDNKIFTDNDPKKFKKFKSFKVSLNHPKTSFITNLQGSSIKTVFFIAILPPPDCKSLAPYIFIDLLKT